MDVENLFTAFQGNLKNRPCSKGLALALGLAVSTAIQ